LLWPTVQLLPGVQKLVLHLKKHSIPIAVATSSRRRKYNMKTGHFTEVFGCFEEKVVCGDDFPGKMKGKPEPDIFLTAAREQLGRKVGEHVDCSEEEMEERGKGLVFEDAIPGMQAGKRAGMSGKQSAFTIHCPSKLIPSRRSGMGPRCKSIRYRVLWPRKGRSNSEIR
jgi:pseudouridine-5'-monophosphatase